MSTARTALVAQSLGRQDALWRAALHSLGMNAVSLARAESLAELVGARGAARRPADLLVIDLAALAEEGLRLDRFGPACRQARPETLLVATLGHRLEVSEPERRWARAQGTFDLVPGLSMTRASEATNGRLEALADALRLPAPDLAALHRSLRLLADEVAEAEGDVVARLAQRGIDIGEIARRMRGSAGVPLGERRYRVKWYPNCFVGSEAVDWLVRGYGLARDEAVELGQHLLERGTIHHVVKEQPFADGEFFYRFNGSGPKLDSIEIDALVQKMRAPGGLEIGERSYLGRGYASCFVGRDAVDFVCAGYGTAREDAVTLGQRLVDLRLVHHVLDEHEFADGYFFYRFFADEPACAPDLS
jgi:hypothetical protein